MATDEDELGRLYLVTTSLFFIKSFTSIEKIDLKKSITERLDLFEPLIEAKNLTIETTFLKTDSLYINPDLAEILVSNLLSNAIRHNILNGQISVQLMEKKLIISNTGKPTALNSEQIFKRFVKRSGTVGMGLGLALVESICKQYNFKISYEFINNRHVFTLQF